MNPGECPESTTGKNKTVNERTGNYNSTQDKLFHPVSYATEHINKEKEN